MTGRTASFTIFALLIVMTLLMPGMWGNPGGVDDDDPQDYGGCGCHSTTGSGTITMWAESLELAPGQEVRVSINVTGAELSDAKIVGVFLLRDLTGSDDDPTLDGWTIMADPNGGQEHYVEQVAQDVATELPFPWTLKAPTQVGEYRLVTMIDHGGGKGYKGTDPTGLRFNVTLPVEPQFGDHTYPATVLVNEPIPLTANFTDDEGIEEVFVTYLPVGATEHKFINMELVSGTDTDGQWAADLPAQTQGGELHFDITASDRDHFTECHPLDHIITIEASGTPLLEHTALTWAYVEREALLRVSAQNVPEGVTLFFRSVDETSFDSVEMTAGTGDNFTVQLPAQTQTGILEYYLYAANGTLNTTSPLYTVEVRPYIDLSVLEVQLSEEPRAGTEVVLTVTLHNEGTLLANGVWLNVADDFYPEADLAYVGQLDNLTIQAEDYLRVRIWWTPQDPDQEGQVHRLRICVGYADGDIKEAFEVNNVLTQEVAVAPEGEHEGHSPRLVDQLILGGLLALGGLCILLLFTFKRLAADLLGPADEREGR